MNKQKLNEDQMTPFENLQLNMLLAYAADTFNVFSDSMYGDYEVTGIDKDKRKITVKVVIEK